MHTKTVSILLTFSICISYTYAQNETMGNDTALNGTTTLTPLNGTETTLFFTTGTDAPTIEPTIIPTMEPTMDTIDPTMDPTMSPSSDPTTDPTISLAENEVRLFKLTQQLTGEGVDKSWVEDNEQLLITLCIESAGAEDDDGFRCDIGKVTEIYESQTSRRRLLQGAVVGVEVEYLISIDDPESVNAFEDRVDSGEFNDDFSEGITVNYEDIVVETVSLSDEGTADPDKLDDFFGDEPPTFGEKLASEYILLGIVCGMVGVIWLLFLRSTIENKYPSYLESPAKASSPSGSNGVEMVPQTSAASAAEEEEVKEKNKQEMQEAWNEVDGGAETEL